MIKKIFISIPLQRLILYFIICALVPVFIIFYHFVKEKGELHQLRERLDQVRVFAIQKEQKQALNQQVRKHYANAESLYLEQSLETLCFLRKEKESLEHLFESKTFTGNETAETRYQYLIGDANRLHFSQGSVQTAEGVQETLEILLHPVEVDGSDIKEILSRIESKRSRQPQLIVADFKLIKKSPPQKSEVFEFHVKLLKREFLSS